MIEQVIDIVLRHPDDRKNGRLHVIMYAGGVEECIKVVSLLYPGRNVTMWDVIVWTCKNINE